MVSHFDPGSFYEFHLSKGLVYSRGGDRVVVLPEDMLSAVFASAATGFDSPTLMVEMGERIGALIAESVGEAGEALKSAPPDAVLGHCATVLSLFGWGRLSMELWGAVVVMRVESCALGPDSCGWMLSGMIRYLTETPVWCVPVPAEEAYVVLSEEAAAPWVEGRWEAVSVIEVVSRLEAAHA